MHWSVYGYNLYGIRDNIINTIKLGAYYLSYNEIEIWEYIVQYEDVKIINEVFVLDLEMKLNKANKKN